MEELEKDPSRDVELPGAPHECLAVLDATTGQMPSPSDVFDKAIGLTDCCYQAGRDGKGGIVVGISITEDSHQFIGIGETMDDSVP